MAMTKKDYEAIAKIIKFNEKREPKPKVNPDFHDYIDLEFVLRKE